MWGPCGAETEGLAAPGVTVELLAVISRLLCSWAEEVQAGGTGHSVGGGGSACDNTIGLEPIGLESFRVIISTNAVCQAVLGPGHPHSEASPLWDLGSSDGT